MDSRKITLFMLWLSTIIFLIHIFTGYVMKNPSQWDETLPALSDDWYNKFTFGLHLFGGVLIMNLVPLQIILARYNKYPFVKKIHKRIGYFLVVWIILTSLGGLLFIFKNNTIGDLNMSVSFAIYGLIFIFCAVKLYRTINRDYLKHEEWAFRILALTLSSWFYRVLYMLAVACGYEIDTHNPEHFKRPIDILFIWLFYPLPLLFSELYIKFIRYKLSPDYNVYRAINEDDS